MRYGEPSLSSALSRLRAAGVTDLLLVPLYPQYADSTWTTTTASVREQAGQRMHVEVLPPFFDRADYIAAQAAVIHEHLTEDWDHLLLSYHGLPERHLTRTDPTGNHCLQSPDCCERPSPAHATCYRHQCLRTSTLLAQTLGLNADRYTVSFQSRLGRLPWLTPYTDQTLAALPGRGVRRLVVACPAFVADNLETLEEIGMAGRDLFLGAGGERFTLVPCLNDRTDWVQALAGWCEAPVATSIR
jgi:ferrochelatase